MHYVQNGDKDLAMALKQLIHPLKQKSDAQAWVAAHVARVAKQATKSAFTDAAL